MSFCRADFNWAGLFICLPLLFTGCEVSNLEEVTTTETVPAVTQTDSSGPSTGDSGDDTDDKPVAGGSGIGPNGGGGGFLWKPISESNGKLVVLLPPQYTGFVSTVFVGTSSGQVIDQGNYGGVHNGGREHYRFSKPGASYGNNVYVVADLKAGGAVHWVVPVGSQRTSF